MSSWTRSWKRMTGFTAGTEPWILKMSEKRIGIIMNGVTGRMGTNQHLVRSILAIREQGGVDCVRVDVGERTPLTEVLARVLEKLGWQRWAVELRVDDNAVAGQEGADGARPLPGYLKKVMDDNEGATVGSLGLFGKYVTARRLDA